MTTQTSGTDLARDTGALIMTCGSRDQARVDELTLLRSIRFCLFGHQEDGKPLYPSIKTDTLPVSLYTADAAGLIFLCRITRVSRSDYLDQNRGKLYSESRAYPTIVLSNDVHDACSSFACPCGSSACRLQSSTILCQEHGYPP
jgi:hypothetical protein